MLGQLDEISASPGFIMDEATTGTSGLGTPLEVGGPAAVWGTEHFTSLLDGLCAVGSPIRRPITGCIEGVVDIVCPAGLGTTFMQPLITLVAHEVEQSLLNGHSATDRALLEGFLQTERRGRRRPLVAVNSRFLMTNTLAGDMLGGGMGRQAVLWEQVRRALADGQTTLAFALDGEAAPLHGSIRQLRDGGTVVGAVVRLYPTTMESKSAGIGSSFLEHDVHRKLLTVLPGRSNVWSAVLRRSARSVGNGGRLLLVGASGTGKATLAVALLEARENAGNIARFDGRDIRDGVHRWISPVEKLGSSASALLFTHLEQLDLNALELMCRRLDELTAVSCPIIATYLAGGAEHVPPPQIMAQFENVVEVPSLADRREDIPDIVRVVLDDRDGLPVQVEPAALRQLMSRDWPGNVRQLRRVVVAARDRCSSRTIMESDLPDAFRALTARKQLSRFERAERDVIATALVATRGNRRNAAAELGISRSTFYRKLAKFGVDL
ncbi:helix-turn-helix domain-containing protein [Mycobacterium vicinigordonae]|uniref:Sigma-54 factor interaction domain-containing protein n=1 Tax=Mycobacterium vicinigordonae TaxID=1719132 RepID=A0A7D6IQ77_9MYCO|nr:helix-turn-helix domain-containing protein [Mycobacterium vicinigordonae]QLL06259.1 hypothetical protein H0P51_21220 [Mycobacterium vicinigordonae]